MRGFVEVVFDEVEIPLLSGAVLGLKVGLGMPLKPCLYCGSP